MIKFSILFLSCCLFAYALTENYPGYYWRDYRGKVPYDAFETDEGLLLGQVHTSTGLLPATFYPNSSEAYATCFGSRIIVKNPIKLLCDECVKRFYWEYVNIEKVINETLEELVIGGIEDDITLYVGKVYHEGEWRIGKVYPPDHKLKGLTVWGNDGNDCTYQDFQILKYNGDITDIHDKKGWL